MQHEIDIIVELIKGEKPEEYNMLTGWLAYRFPGNPELVDEIKSIEEVKTMLSTSLKKYGEELKQEGKLEGKLDIARNLLKERMPVDKIAAVTGLPLSQIEKIRDKN